MFMSRWFQKAPVDVPVNKAEASLAEIQKLLFPPLELKTDEQDRSYHVDKSIDGNLYAILLELEEGVNDEITQNTLKSVLSSVTKIREILNIYNDMNPEAQYLIVENTIDKKNFTS